MGGSSDNPEKPARDRCALDILAQSAWPQAHLVVDEHGCVVGFEDDVYDGGALFLKKQRYATERGDT